MLTPKQKQYIGRFSRLGTDIKRVNGAIDVLLRHRELDAPANEIAETHPDDDGAVMVSNRLLEIRDKLADKQRSHPLMAFLKLNVK